MKLKRGAALLALLLVPLALGGCMWFAGEDTSTVELNYTVVPQSYTVYFTVENAPEVDLVDWFFGDGVQTTTTTTSIKHNYAEPGEYTVTAVLHLASASAGAGGGGGGGIGPASLLVPNSDKELVTLTTVVVLKPIKPIELQGFTVEVVTPPPWWTPGGEDHYPEGASLKFTAQWHDYIPDDDIAPYGFRWWAVRIEDGQVMAYGDGETWTCPGLLTVGGCHSRVTPYRIIVVMYCTNGSTLRYERTIFIEPTTGG